MCTTCGCSDDAAPKITDLQTGQTIDVSSGHIHHRDHEHQNHEHDHHHDGDDDDDDDDDNGHMHAHSHYSPDHSHGDASASNTHVSGRRTIRLEREILAKNNRLAERNRGWFAGRKVLALNLMSSPGAGKTTLLERTVRDLKDDFPITVIEGDQATLNDAQRIKATGCRVVQINTGTGCHLEADMLARGLEQLDPPMNSIVLIENVGNLVCPALFDLGEHAKAVVVAVTDGDDKPIKYPHMFRASQVLILNKIDLFPYVQFNVDRCLEYARQVNPHLTVFQVSATSGDGLDNWYEWIRREFSQHLTFVSSALA